MQYSLYTLYSNSSLDLYQVREHYLEHFYYNKHGRKEVENVLKTIVRSSKITRLLAESRSKRIVPSYEDFLTTICSMLKFMFKSCGTNVLAAIDAALRWDIEVNSQLNLISEDGLKNEMVKAFAKFSIYEEMTEEEFHSLESTSQKDSAIPQEEINPNQTTWSLVAFTHQFGRCK